MGALPVRTCGPNQPGPQSSREEALTETHQCPVILEHFEGIKLRSLEIFVGAGL